MTFRDTDFTLLRDRHGQLLENQEPATPDPETVSRIPDRLFAVHQSGDLLCLIGVEDLDSYRAVGFTIKDVRTGEVVWPAQH
ncbi:hypothetical protein HNR42_001307 [Deinobacterium chartae]|uniref:Uncharacterized protein n=1 Tax=Deinobacterium chartae TaxID=521158 RepID=A0A841HYY5_9DEIO|nr:hypothetical protein [Deinobacterium chartae]MBB6097884.1 hypothetical protein [Deinobacterium chartae]